MFTNFGSCLLIVLLLGILYAWIAATESSLEHVSDSRIKVEAENGGKKAQKLLQILNERFRYQIDLQIGMMVILICTTCLFSLFLFPNIFIHLASRGYISAQTADSDGAILLGSLLFALIFILFARILPEKYATIRHDQIAKHGCGIASVVHFVLWPVTTLFLAVSTVILKVFGIKQTSADDQVTEEEIRAMVDMGEELGAIEENEKEMIENVFEFNNHSAQEVMIHRTKVKAIWIGDSDKEILDTIRQTGLSRFPVYNDSMDDIIGILNTRDFLMNRQDPNPRSLRALLRKVYFVPETVPADTLFRDMQKKKMHMAVVVDEYGGMSGIVTMEDLLEEIVGNIYDEFDPLDEVQVVKIDENKWRSNGSVALEDLAEVLGVELPLEEEYDTLGGMVFSKLTTIPQDGSHPVIDVEPLHIEVERLVDHRVEQAIVSIIEPKNTDSDDENDDSDDERRK